MFNRHGAGGTSRMLVSALGVLLFGGTASAAVVVGQSTTSASSNIWATNTNFSSIYAVATAPGPGGVGGSVTGPQAITQQALANNTHYVISNPTSSAGDLNALVNWVNAGGILMLFVDQTGGANSVAALNTILAAFGTGASGSALSISSSLLLPSSITSQLTAASLAGTDKAVVGPPNNVGGASVAMFNPYGVSGGSTLAINLLGSALRVDSFQLGKVYVFGNTFNSNDNMGAGLANQQFFLNLLTQTLMNQGGGGGGPTDAPEPGSILLMSSGIVGLLLYARRRKG